MPRLLPLDRVSAGVLLKGQTAQMVAAEEVAGVFTPEQCDRIVTRRDALGFDDAKVENRDAAGSKSLVHTIRQTERTHLLPSPEHAWIFERLGAVVGEVNARAWQFRVSHMEPLQLLRYHSRGHYAWHADLGTRGIMSLRKISITVQLSDSDDYEGGDLEIKAGGRSIVPARPRGSAVLFPSWQPHRVTPVTSGVRDALVLWVVGKRPLR
jgi:PKHD-type hydroxylase